ncbi:MAG: hypothetical protein H9W81_13885 [Enterococcus sp.]|nr:hypothetical protein [Enterococcus sp.]
MNTALTLQRRNLPSTGSPFYYHRQNTNIDAINKVMRDANLTDEQKKTIVSSVTELVKNSVRDGLDQTGN